MKRRTFLIGSAITGAFCYGAYRVLSIERTPIEGVYTIYGLSGCIWCRAVRETMQINRLPHAFFDVQRNQEAMNFAISHRYDTFPQIYGPDKSYIGGFADLEKHLKAVHNIDIIYPKEAMK